MFFLLEPYHVSTSFKQITKPLSPIKVNGEGKYEVEEISDCK
jgi:hypothetical protein